METRVAGFEVLSVQHVATSTQTAIVETHHAWRIHVQATAPSTVAAGADLTVAVQLVTWDTGRLITGEDMTLDVAVGGQVVDQLTTKAGKGQAVIQFADPGLYHLTFGTDTVEPAELEVVVS